MSESKELQKKFVPPLVFVGTPIQWFRTRSDAKQGLNPCAAVVTRNDGMTLCCWALPFDMVNGYPKMGVRHVNDPDAHPNHERNSDAGWWQEVPDSPRDTQATAIREAATGRQGQKQREVQGAVATTSSASGTTE